jgi:hypothetical protein
VTAITTYGFPVLKISVEFDGGASAVVGACTDFCYATRIDFAPGERVTAMALYDFVDDTNTTHWSAFGGMRISTMGPAGNRTVNLGYSGVTPWSVGGCSLLPYPLHACRQVGQPCACVCHAPACQTRLGRFACL